MKKQQLRKFYSEKRYSLSSSDYELKNQSLLKQFTLLNIEGIHCIHLFLPIASKREPDTWLIIDWLKLKHPEITLAYPKADFRNLLMTHYQDDADLNLAESDKGIIEPEKGNKIAIDKIDMIVVPLLIFDKKGYRVGYGKGFYDRFMAECKPTTKFTGLSLFEPVDQIDDVDKLDMRLSTCITPGKTWVLDHSAPL